MRTRTTVGALALGALCATALAIAPVAGADTATTTRVIEVIGDATLSARNDLATLTVAVEVARPTRTAALRAATARARRVRAALAKLGIAAADVQTTDITVQRTRGISHGRRITRFRVTNEVAVTVRKASQTGRVIDGVTTAGATDVSGPEFALADPKPLYRRALDNAYDEARAKAEQLATRAGATLGPVISIREGVCSSVSEDGAGGQVRANAPTPVSTGTTDVEGIVTVVYELR